MIQGDVPSPEVERLAEQAAADPAALAAILVAVGPERVAQPVREASAAALKLLARRKPRLIFARWDELAVMLDCGNAFSRMITVHVMAILAPADDTGRLASILDRLYDRLGDMVSVAGHVLQVSPQIATVRPELRDRITARILDLPQLARPDRLGLLRSYAIEAFDAYLQPADRTPEIVGFVEAGLLDDSPRSRKLAADVLLRWGATGRKPTADEEA